MFRKRFVHIGAGLQRFALFGLDCGYPRPRRRHLRRAVLAAAIVDAESVRGREWSVVKSLKLVRPSLPIILLDERSSGRSLSLPEGVDELVSITSLERLPDAIKHFVRAIEQLPRPGKTKTTT